MNHVGNNEGNYIKRTFGGLTIFTNKPGAVK